MESEVFMAFGSSTTIVLSKMVFGELQLYSIEGQERFLPTPKTMQASAKEKNLWVDRVEPRMKGPPE